MQTDPAMVQRYREKMNKLLKALGQKEWARRALEAENVMQLNVLAGIAYRKMIEGRPQFQKQFREKFERLGFDVNQAQEEIQGSIADKIMHKPSQN